MNEMKLYCIQTMAARLGGRKQKKLIIHPSTSMRFLLFYSPKPRSKVRILIYRKWSNSFRPHPIFVSCVAPRVVVANDVIAQALCFRFVSSRYLGNDFTLIKHRSELSFLLWEGTTKAKYEFARDQAFLRFPTNLDEIKIKL